MKYLQYVGLAEEATAFIQKKDRIEMCGECGHEKEVRHYKIKEYAIEKVFAGEHVSLHEYWEGEKLVYKEEIQESPQPHYPVVFLKLVDVDGKDVYVWSEERMEAYL